MSYTVTIGLPTYNAAHTISLAMRSIFAQSLENWELIIINDGSTDDSLEIINEIDDPRIQVINDSENRGLPDRLNQIARMANGKYLARMDADDIMHPERLAQQVAYLDAHPEVEVVGTATYSIDSGNKLTGKRSLGPLSTQPSDILKHGLFIHPTIMGRTEWFRKHPYDPAYVRAEDKELWCRTCRYATFAKLRQPLLFYREAKPSSPRRYLVNYSRSCQTDRTIFRKYGPSEVGNIATYRLIAVSYLKELTYRLATAVGLQSRLIEARNTPLTVKEMKEATSILEHIQKTPVPGLTD